jgi:transposase
VRERLLRFNAEGLDGLGDRSGPGRKPWLTEAERSIIVGLVTTAPPGRLLTPADGSLVAADLAEAHWTLSALTAARERGIAVHRSQERRILLREGARWQPPRAWATRTDPEFAPKGRPSSRSTPSRRRRVASAAPTNSAR